jgi:hypothetical protein
MGRIVEVGWAWFNPKEFPIIQMISNLIQTHPNFLNYETGTSRFRKSSKL